MGAQSPGPAGSSTAHCTLFYPYTPGFYLIVTVYFFFAIIKTLSFLLLIRLFKFISTITLRLLCQTLSVLGGETMTEV